MKAEDGIQGTVDHLHRTIYGALVEGKMFEWMKDSAAGSSGVSLLSDVVLKRIPGMRHQPSTGSPLFLSTTTDVDDEVRQPKDERETGCGRREG